MPGATLAGGSRRRKATGSIQIVPLPWAEPFEAALNLRDEPGLVLLKSRPGFGALGRRSYLAARPAAVATPGLADLDLPRRMVGRMALL